MASIIKNKGLKEFYTDEKCYITELSNSSADKELSIARARVEVGVTTNWHILKGTTERYHILQGAAKVEVGELKPTLIGVGDTVIIPPECPQRITNIGAEDLIFLAICTPPFRDENYEDIEDLKSGKLVKVSFFDFEMAYEYIQATSEEYFAVGVIHKKTGEIYTKSDYDAGIEEPFPNESELDQYIYLPNKRDLNLGTHLVDRFVNDVIPGHFDKISHIFSRRGAYRRFKGYLDRIGKLDEWYDFENKTTKDALINWARKAGFELVE